MSSSIQSWSLYNEKTDVQIDRLKLSQAQSIVVSLNPIDFKYWQAWHEGLSAWEPLNNFRILHEAQTNTLLESEDEIIKYIKVSAKAQKPITKLGITEKKTSREKINTFDFGDEDFEKSRLMIVKGLSKDTRSNSRFQNSYKVKIQVAGVLYECHTLDVSVGGMRIDRPLPLSTGSALLACELICGVQTFALTCLAIPDPKLKGSTRLVIKKLKDPQLLTSWLLQGS